MEKVSIKSGSLLVFGLPTTAEFLRFFTPLSFKVNSDFGGLRRKGRAEERKLGGEISHTGLEREKSPTESTKKETVCFMNCSCCFFV